MSIKISAIVSTYNSESFLASRLQNLLAQTVANCLEIIVINSGSCQGERAIVHEIQRQHRNVRYIETERETLYQAWNRGILAAQGEYIANANTDDRLFSQAYEKLSAALDKNPCAAVAYADEYFTEIESDISDFTEDVLPHWNLVARPMYSHKDLLLDCLCGAQPMWRRSIHESKGYFDTSFRAAADYEFWLRVAEDFSLVHVAEPLGLVFENPKGIVNSDLALATQENWLIRLKYFGTNSGASVMTSKHADQIPEPVQR